MAIPGPTGRSHSFARNSAQQHLQHSFRRPSGIRAYASRGLAGVLRQPRPRVRGAMGMNTRRLARPPCEPKGSFMEITDVRAAVVAGPDGNAIALAWGLTGGRTWGLTGGRIGR